MDVVGSFLQQGAHVHRPAARQHAAEPPNLVVRGAAVVTVASHQSSMSGSSLELEEERSSPSPPWPSRTSHGGVGRYSYPPSERRRPRHRRRRGRSLGFDLGERSEEGSG